MATPPSDEDVIAAVAAGIDGTSTVLEIACGNGARMAGIARAVGCWMWGIETDPGLLAQARAQNPKAEFRQSGPERIPYPDEGFDAVYTVGVDALGDDLPRVMGEVYRVLVDGGALVVFGADPDLAVLDDAAEQAGLRTSAEGTGGRWFRRPELDR